jgi:hypothetical protein
MERVEQQRRSANEVAEVTMTLIDADGRERARTATFGSKPAGAQADLHLIRFHTPADLARSGVLTIENADREYDQWVYLPAYHTTRRIASSSRRDNYMGTDFAYEDIVEPDAGQSAHRLLREEACDGIACAVVESTPEHPRLKAETGYARTVAWVDPERAVVVRKEYYGLDGDLLKTLANSELETFGAKRRWRKTVMTDVRRNHRTVMVCDKREVGAGLTDAQFTERYLKRGQ